MDITDCYSDKIFYTTCFKAVIAKKKLKCQQHANYLKFIIKFAMLAENNYFVTEFIPNAINLINMTII